MKLDQRELRKYPDHLNKQQFRTVCHISPRTAYYLLISGLVPAINTGKKTHTWKIYKDDIIAFAEDYRQHPIKYLPPDNWYVYGEATPNRYAVRILPPDNKVSREKQKEYFTKLLECEQNLLTVRDITRLTGYNKNTVTGWVRKGHLSIHFEHSNRFLFPKKYVLDFLCSDYYCNIQHKSMQHIDMLFNINGLEKPVYDEQIT